MVGWMGIAPVPMMSSSYGSACSVPAGSVMVTRRVSGSMCARAMVEAQPDAVGFDVVGFAVREVVPVGGLPAEEEREAADAVVGVGVGHHDGHVARRVEFPGTQGGADAGVAAADDEHLGHVASRSVPRCRLGPRRAVCRLRRDAINLYEI